MARSKPAGEKKAARPWLEKAKESLKELKKQVQVVYIAAKDRRTPWYAKAVAGLVVAYALSPIDLIPDFIPVLGYLDDLLIVPAGIALAVKLIPKEIMTEARQKVEHPTSN
jgi:uncharacterized membrane protein YkvA (DUF1232 family)